MASKGVSSTVKVERGASGTRLIDAQSRRTLTLSDTEARLLEVWDGSTDASKVSFLAQQGGIPITANQVTVFLDRLAKAGFLAAAPAAPREPIPDLGPDAPTAIVPRVRGDLEVVRAPDHGSLVHIRDPKSQRSFTLYDFEASIARMLDGRRTADDVIQGANRIGIPVTLDSLRKFIRQLHAYGFIDESEPLGGEQTTWAKRKRWDPQVRALYQGALRMSRAGRAEEAVTYLDALKEVDPENEEAQQLRKVVEAQLAEAQPIEISFSDLHGDDEVPAPPAPLVEIPLIRPESSSVADAEPALVPAPPVEPVATPVLPAAEVAAQPIALVVEAAPEPVAPEAVAPLPIPLEQLAPPSEGQPLPSPAPPPPDRPPRVSTASRPRPPVRAVPPARSRHGVWIAVVLTIVVVGGAWAGLTRLVPYRVQASARLEPIIVGHILAPRAGAVAVVRVATGALVQEGDEVATLDTAPTQVELTRLERQIQEAKAKTAPPELTPKELKREVKLEGKVAKLQTSLEDIEGSRQKELARAHRHARALAALDQAVVKLHASLAKIDEKREALLHEHERQEAEKQVAALEAQVPALQAILDHSSIRVSAPGRLGGPPVEVGHPLAAGAEYAPLVGPALKVFAAAAIAPTAPIARATISVGGQQIEVHDLAVQPASTGCTVTGLVELPGSVRAEGAVPLELDLGTQSYYARLRR